MKDSYFKSFLVLFTAAVFSFSAKAQSQKGDFFGFFNISANFCQIDGDGASGFNKFGFTAGYQVGQVLKEAPHGNWSYLGGAAFSVRGSRRAFDPDNPGNASFNYVYQMIDIPVSVARYYDKYSVSAGLRTTYLLSAKDLDNFTPDLNANMKQLNILACLAADYRATDNLRVVLEYQYSINSIRNSTGRAGLLFPTGVYHNVISAGVRIQPGGSKK